MGRALTHAERRRQHVGVRSKHVGHALPHAGFWLKTVLERPKHVGRASQNAGNRAFPEAPLLPTLTNWKDRSIYHKDAARVVVGTPELKS